MTRSFRGRIVSSEEARAMWLGRLPTDDPVVEQARQMIARADSLIRQLRIELEKEEERAYWREQNERSRVPPNGSNNSKSHHALHPGWWIQSAEVPYELLALIDDQTGLLQSPWELD